MEHFSDRLRRIRKERKLSQAELARASGLSQGAISSYETGNRKSTTGLVELAQALKVNPVWLITGTGDREIEPVGTSHHATTPARLQERQPSPAPAAWPFTIIKAEAFWALTESERHIVEQAMAALIKALGQQDNRD